jgi:hypothetical protein
MQKARWSTAVAAAALLALPVVGSAQSTQGSSQQNPPAQSQPPASTSQQPPASATQQPPAASAAAQPGQIDTSAAKQHLSEARESLSQITSMPEATKLQGSARTGVSQLISDFNALITTQAEWRSAYAKVDSDLTTLLGPEAGEQSVGTSGSTSAIAGATGTTGTTAAGGSGAAGSTGEAGAAIDPAIRSKLVEFRAHLSAFEKAAGGTSPAASTQGATPNEPAGATSTAAAGSMPPAMATSSTANPANPAQSVAAGDQPRPTGTSGVSSSSPTASMSASDREQASRALSTADKADAQKELDAISAILNGSKTGTLTKAQTTQLKQHIESLQSILARQ